jgi:tetratricopeptide (TPR) repeat protein
VEAISNTAATLYCLNRQVDAEQHWLRAIKMRPQYLEAVEHLVGLLYKKRSREAVDVITYVQEALMLEFPDSGERATDLGLKADICTSRQRSVAANIHGPPSQPTPTIDSEASSPGFGSSGYAIPGNENGRMLALIHAKGTMLYSLKDVNRASKAFEEAVLISAGRHMRCIQNLVRRIQVILGRPEASSHLAASANQDLSRPLLLPPERARHTAQLVFSGSGDLPGLCYVPDGSPRRAAIQTTSNSLLSLAKIFQDSMSSGSLSSGLLQQPSGVGDILALYYLSLSLQESPSTANNVGILLASVQQPSITSPAPPTGNTPHSIPGIVPGSGLALALAYYNYGLRLDPKHVHLHTNLGSLLKDIGHLDLAIQMYEQAVSCDGTFDIALTNLANAVKDRGRIGDAISYYKRAVTANPDFAEAVCGLATALNSVCDWRGRGGVFIGDGLLDRWHVDDDGMLHDVQTLRRGSGLVQRVVDIVVRQLEDSAHWGTGVLQPNTLLTLARQIAKTGSDGSTDGLDVSARLRKWVGTPWEGSRVLRLVERSTRSTMRRWYFDRYVLGVEATSDYIRPRIPPSLTVPSAPTVLPFHTFTCPLSARDIRRISQRNALRISCSTLRSPWLPPTTYPPPRPPNPHLNVGYVSSDFNNHPLAHL